MINLQPASGSDRLALVDGFDLARGLRNLGGQEPILLRALCRFVQAYRDGLLELARLDTPQDMTLGALASQELCGACATIGATQMQILLHDFERLINTAPDAPTLAEQADLVNRALRKLVAQLAQALTMP